MFKVVIDTNVFISAFYLPESRPAEVVHFARKRKVLKFISLKILEEVDRILQKKLLWDQAKTQSALAQIRKFSEIVSPQEHLAVITDDPDNRILECALEAQVDFIVSGDKHLLNLKTYRGITIVTPVDFLESCQ